MHEERRAVTIEAADPLISIKEVSLIVGLKKTAIGDRMRAGTFAPALRLSTRCTRWRLSSIKAWVAQQEATQP